MSDFLCLYTRVSPPRHHRHVGPNNSLLGGCPAHHRLLSSISGLHPLDANSILIPAGILPNVPWSGDGVAEHPGLRTTALDYWFKIFKNEAHTRIFIKISTEKKDY